MKVLLADPDWRFSQQVAGYLERHAHLVVSHAEALEVQSRVKAWGPDLVILAAELAQDGLLKELHSKHPRPAVLLTEHMDRYDRAWQAWQEGGDELLLKPMLHSDDLHKSIVVALENAATGTRRQSVAQSA